MIATITLAACGGGGGGGSPGDPSTLSGTAATGHPIVSGTVQVLCAGGNSLTTTTNSTGAWQVTISGQTPPCAIEISGGTINGIPNSIKYHSIATSFGVANITPLTDLMLANLAGTATPNVWFAGLVPASLTPITSGAVITALSNQCAALTGLSPLCANNPVTMVFTPTYDNLMEYMLLAMNVAMINSGITYASLLSDASAVDYTAPAASFNTALTDAYAATTAAISAAAITTAQSLTVGTAMTPFSPIIPVGGTQPYTYSYTGTLPTGLSFNTSTGLLSGTPTATYAMADVVFSVQDATAVVAATTSTVSFTVAAAPISISAIADTTAQSLTVGMAVTDFSPLTASGGTQPYTYSYTGTLPAGLTFNASTGVVSGTPTAIYTMADVIFSVEDATAEVASTTSTVSFTVSEAAPDITATADPTAQDLIVGTPMDSFSPLLASGGTPPYSYSYTGTLPAGLSFDTGTGAVTGTPTASYASADLVFSVKDANNVVASTTSTVSFTVSVASGSWTATGSMTVARSGHTATLLDNGKVLIAGGINPVLQNRSTELYDPDTGLFTATGSMAAEKYSFTATRLTNGKVLVAGGIGSGFFAVASAELYDPDTGLFTGTGSMTVARSTHRAILLPNGKVLITGGATAELYDPDTELFTATGSMATARTSHAAMLLNNGKVLVAGGTGAGVSAELYDPDTGLFTATGDMVVGRYGAASTLLPDGKVLITGGQGSQLPYLGLMLVSAEVYDPDTGQFTAVADMAYSRTGFIAVLLPNGKVLVAGGFNGISVTTNAELFDPSTGHWSGTGSLLEAKWGAPGVLLPSGDVLISGGSPYNTSTITAELYHQ